jgi:hypothetical protein
MTVHQSAGAPLAGPIGKQRNGIAVVLLSITASCRTP